MKNLQRWILAGLLLGIVSGLAANFLVSEGAPAASWRASLDFAVREVVEPLGKVFLRLLFLTVLPLVFSSLAVSGRSLFLGCAVNSTTANRSPSAGQMPAPMTCGAPRPCRASCCIT